MAFHEPLLGPPGGVAGDAGWSAAHFGRRERTDLEGELWELGRGRTGKDGGRRGRGSRGWPWEPGARLRLRPDPRPPPPSPVFPPPTFIPSTSSSFPAATPSPRTCRIPSAAIRRRR